MNAIQSSSQGALANELKRVVEPLASYICATEKPNSALWSALALLFREVEATNGTAASHVRSLAGAR
jgi:hypothetical protein